MKCKRCFDEIELENSRYFPTIGLFVEIDLCKGCAKDLSDLLNAFFRETQVMQIKW